MVAFDSPAPDQAFAPVHDLLLGATILRLLSDEHSPLNRVVVLDKSACRYLQKAQNKIRTFEVHLTVRRSRDLRMAVLMLFQKSELGHHQHEASNVCVA